MQDLKLKEPQHRSLSLASPEFRAVIDPEARTVELAFSSETPVKRWYGNEILDHSQGAVDLSRLNSGAPLLLGHGGATQQIGVVENAWIGADRVGRAKVRFSKAALGDEIFKDVQDGIRQLVSTSYDVAEYRLDGETNGVEDYRMTKWTPNEISIVSVPADASVGVGRAMPAPADQSQPPAGPSGRTQENAAMADTPAPAETETPAPEGTNNRSAELGKGPTAGPDHVQLERQRMREITAIARQFDQVEMGDAAIDGGMSVDGFRAKVMDKLVDSGAMRVAESPEIGMGERDVKQYSFCRALLAANDPLNAAKLAPFEMECSQAAQDKRGDSRSKEREAAVTIPVDVLMRGIQLPAGAAAAAFGLMAGRRDLTVGTAADGGNLVATELLGSSFIELLRNAMVLNKLGTTFLTGLNGNVAIPSQSGAATGYWVTEGGAPTESQQAVGQVPLTPKTVGAFTDYSRRLLLQSSIDVEAFVRMDLASIVGLAIQLGAINGPGTGGAPTGVLNTSGIGAVVGGTDGAAPTYSDMVDLESAVANANADGGSLAYLTNTKVRGKLRKTEEFATTNGRPVWRSGMQKGVGDVLGYEAFTTNSVPSDLDKGTSTGVCSAILYGNWMDLLIGMWGGLDVMLDPYTGGTSGTKRVIALQDVDVAVRHAESFAAMKDALTA